jgi:hypothetical protein
MLYLLFCKFIDEEIGLREPSGSLSRLMGPSSLTHLCGCLESVVNDTADAHLSIKK